jgi:hypothetical protein
MTAMQAQPDARADDVQGTCIAQPPEPEWSWAYAWRFKTVEKLREEGLEQYTAFSDGIMVTRYGMLGDEKDLQVWECVLRKRAEIDACLGQMKEVGQRRLLDVYYRRGLSVDHRGWMYTANLVRVQGVKPIRCPGNVRCRIADERRDLPTCPAGRHCEWDHDTFESVLQQAVGRLWKVHQQRYSDD